MSDEYDDTEYEIELPDGSTAPAIELPDGWHVPSLGIVVDHDGTPFDAGDGTPLQWTEPEPDYGDERLADLYEAQAQLEQRLSQPQEVVHRHEVAALSQDDIHARWALEQPILESAGGFGRPLTQRELAELGQESAEAGHYSLIQAAEARADRGQALRDVDVAHPGRAHQERVALAAELLDERSDRPPDPFTGMRERQAEEYDTSTRAGRQAQLEDALNGHDVRNRDASYPTTEEETWSYDDAE
jgi:hypothetical protein